VVKELGIGESEGISQQGNCIYISASFANQTRYADKFIYDLLGI
jgi:hypothetical protein